MQAEPSLQAQSGRRQRRGFVLGSLSFGHGVIHLYDQGIYVFMPAITSAMGLNTFQVSTLLAIRQGGFGAVNPGSGLFVDMVKGHWGLILTGCVLLASVSYVIVGASVNYGILLFAIVLVSVPGALWHLPSTASLSQRFPDRRGFAVAIHGLGSNIGNVVGPLLATALLGALVSWRHVFFIYSAPALVTVAFVWWTLNDIGRGGLDERRAINTQLREALALIKNPVVMTLVVVALLRGIGLDAIFAWSPFYLEEELEKSHLEAGFHYALLTGMGIVSAPLLGALSDRLGRKAVIVPGLLSASALTAIVVISGNGFALILVFAGMGLFSFALHQTIQAAMLDIVDRGTEATAMGLLFGINGVVGGLSPFVGYLIIDNLGGYGSIYYYAAILTGVAAFIVMAVPLKGPILPVAAEA